MRAEQVIATHTNTDFDAFASLLAARRLYPGAVVCIGGSLNRNVREFYRLHADDLEIVEAARLELDAVRRLIVVETVHAGRLGELERVARDPAVEKIVFDHHAGELLGELMEKATTQRVAGIEVLLAAISWPRYIEGVSNLAHKLVDLTDCQALVLLVEMDDRVFCVTRSRIADLDAGAAARSLGGGGHAQAASAIFRGSLEEARSLVLDGLPQAIRQPLRARDVMSEPVRSVEPDETVARAMVVCQRHGQSGLLVTQDGRLVGVVSREDLDKAIGHGLSHAPVKGLMSGRVQTAGKDTPLPELQRLLGASAEGRIAILADGRVVGIVTRSDVLRALGATAVEGTEEAESVATRLAELQHLQPVLEAVSSVAEDFDGVYLVGGTVRDILL